MSQRHQDDTNFSIIILAALIFFRITWFNCIRNYFISVCDGFISNLKEAVQLNGSVAFLQIIKIENETQIPNQSPADLLFLI